MVRIQEQAAGRGLSHPLAGVEAGTRSDTGEILEEWEAAITRMSRRRRSGSKFPCEHLNDPRARWRGSRFDGRKKASWRQLLERYCSQVPDLRRMFQANSQLRAHYDQPTERRSSTAWTSDIPGSKNIASNDKVLMASRGAIYRVEDDSKIPATNAIRTSSERLPALILAITLAR